MNEINTDLIGILIGVLGIALGVYFYFKPRRISKKILWKSLGKVPLVDSRVSLIEGIEILHNKIPIANLMMWHGMIWNESNTVIQKKDIPTKVEHLKISFQGAKVLGCKILNATRPEIDFKLNSNSNSGYVELDFEYLDAGDGAEFIVIYEGKLEIEPYVEGVIMGGSINRIDSSQRRFSSLSSRLIIPVTTSLIFFILISYVLILALLERVHFLPLAIIIGISLMLAFLLSFYLVGAFLASKEKYGLNEPDFYFSNSNISD